MFASGRSQGQARGRAADLPAVFGYTTSMATAVREADAHMAVDGFTPGRGPLDAMADRTMADAIQCDVCGNLGHDLRAYVRGRRYRAMAICRGCKAMFEM